MAAEVVMVHPRAPARPGPPQHIRSTLLCSGIAELRLRGHFDAYVEKLLPEARETILTMIAGVWLPMSIAMAHFQAITALELSPDEAFAIGASSGQRIHQTLLHALVRLATGVGASPWTLFENYPRLWARIFDGGGVTISKVGPKDALLEFAAFPPARFAYFRDAFRGANHSGLTLFVTTVYVREMPTRRSPSGFALRVAWV
jgi:hypothetical protein